MRIVLLLLVAMLMVAGCGTRDHQVLAPENTTSFTNLGYISSQYTTREDGVTIRTDTYRGPHGVTIKVIYICDYPKGYAGPPAPGHCREDGTDCTPYPGGPPPPAAPGWNGADSDGPVVKGTDGDPIIIFRGDPTADD